MKILKIFGIVVGIHLFALILIFANPGCSSTTKPAPSASDTAAKPTAPIATTPSSSAATTSAATDTSSTSSAITFNPNSPAAAAPSSATEGPRVAPTRPNSPVAGVLAPEPVSGITPASTYTVKSGDNLWTIAKKHNLTVAQLTAANSISTNASLRPGQKLIIPSKPAPSPTSTNGISPMKAPDATSTMPSAKSGEVKHVVKAGETLGGIAKKYDVRQGDIAVANNIVDPAKIRPGMELIIPGYQSPSKSGKSSKSSKAPSTSPSSSTAPTLPIDSTPSASSTPPPATPAVPVIRIDDNPPPAPKL